MISPNYQWLGQPFNVLPYMQYPNMIDAATKGLKLGQQIAALPQEGRENAYQYMMAGVAKEKASQLQQAIKDIQSDKTLTPAQKSQKVDWLLGQSGVQFGQQAATMSPLSGIQGGLGIQKSLMDIQNTVGQNPAVNYTNPGFGPPPVAAPVGPAPGQPDPELQQHQTNDNYF